MSLDTDPHPEFGEDRFVLQSYAMTQGNAPLIAVPSPVPKAAEKRSPRMGEEEIDLLEFEFKKSPKPTTHTKRQFAENTSVDLARINRIRERRAIRKKLALLIAKRGQEASKPSDEIVESLQRTIADQAPQPHGGSISTYFSGFSEKPTAFSDADAFLQHNLRNMPNVPPPTADSSDNNSCSPPSPRNETTIIQRVGKSTASPVKGGSLRCVLYSILDPINSTGISTFPINKQRTFQFSNTTTADFEERMTPPQIEDLPHRGPREDESKSDSSSPSPIQENLNTETAPDGRNELIHKRPFERQDTAVGTLLPNLSRRDSQIMDIRTSSTVKGKKPAAADNVQNFIIPQNTEIVEPSKTSSVEIPDGLYNAVHVSSSILEPRETVMRYSIHRLESSTPESSIGLILSLDVTNSEENSEVSSDESIASCTCEDKCPTTSGVGSSTEKDALATRKALLLDTIMTDFWVLFNRNWLAPVRTCGGSEGNYSSSSGGPSLLVLSDSLGRNSLKRGRDHGDEEDPSDDKKEGPKRPRDASIPLNSSKLNMNFACPYRKNNPRKYCVQFWGPCALTPLKTVSRVKEHLYRHHIIHQCQRCKACLKTEDLLNEHIEAAEACELKPSKVVDGITRKMKEKLQCRKKAFPGQTQVDRWEEIYKMLFPNEELPSPYFEAVREQEYNTPQSQETTDISNYEEYVRSELPRVFRTSLEAVVNGELQPIEERIQEKIGGLIEDALNKVHSSYHARTNLNAVFGSPIRSVEESQLTVEGIPVLESDPLTISHSRSQPADNRRIRPLEALERYESQISNISSSGSGPALGSTSSISSQTSLFDSTETHLTTVPIQNKCDSIACPLNQHHSGPILGASEIMSNSERVEILWEGDGFNGVTDYKEGTEVDFSSFDFDCVWNMTDEGTETVT